MFAYLPVNEHVDRVLSALQNLLGDHPTRADYAARLNAVAVVVKTFEAALRHMPTDEQL